MAEASSSSIFTWVPSLILLHSIKTRRDKKHRSEAGIRLQLETGHMTPKPWALYFTAVPKFLYNVHAVGATELASLLQENPDVRVVATQERRNVIYEHIVMKTRRSHILDHFFHQHIQIDTSKTQYVLDEPAHRTSIVLVPFVARKQNCDVSKMIGNLGPIGERAL